MPDPTDSDFLYHVTRTHPLPMMVGLRLRAIAGRLKPQAAQPAQPAQEHAPGLECLVFLLGGIAIGVATGVLLYA